jgi:hypothetical protein
VLDPMVMLRSFRRNGGRDFRTGSSWQRHDHARRQGSNTAIASFALAAEPGAGINPKTVAKWRKRETVEDMKTGPMEPRSTVLSEAEEAMVVASSDRVLLVRWIQAPGSAPKKNVRRPNGSGSPAPL